MTAGGDGGRLITQNSDVYDRSNALVGRIPFHGIAHASRDSRRAFMYVLEDRDTQAHLEIYDLTGPLDASGVYPRIRTLMLPDTAGSPGESIFAPRDDGQPRRCGAVHLGPPQAARGAARRSRWRVVDRASAFF